MNYQITNLTDEKVNEKDLESVINKVSQTLGVENSIVSIVLTGDEHIHEINKIYRGIDRPTDVISFAFLDEETNPNNITDLGEIYISLEKAHTQAVEYNHSFKRELCFLLTHGLLHLLGYDHMTKEDRAYSKDEYNDDFVYHYVTIMRNVDSTKYIPENKNPDYPSLTNLIRQDPKLKYIYADDVFILKVDNDEYQLSSQILKKSRSIIYLTKNSKVTIYMKKHLINEECIYPDNNSLYIMLLSGNLVTYGDEVRTKQCHVTTTQVYKCVLENRPSDKKDYYAYDITNLIAEYKTELSKDNPNNLFFTTSSLRDYHYLKQKNNAYYHIQAINLPFQNIEFYYLEKEYQNE